MLPFFLFPFFFFFSFPFLSSLFYFIFMFMNLEICCLRLLLLFLTFLCSCMSHSSPYSAHSKTVFSGSLAELHFPVVTFLFGGSYFCVSSSVYSLLNNTVSLAFTTRIFRPAIPKFAHFPPRSLPRCQAKYGKFWAAYTRAVPYRYIPGLW